MHKPLTSFECILLCMLYVNFLNRLNLTTLYQLKNSNVVSDIINYVSKNNEFNKSPPKLDKHVYKLVGSHHFIQIQVTSKQIRALTQKTNRFAQDHPNLSHGV